MEALRALIEALPEGLRRQAFTHASWVGGSGDSYERLEFLGDGVLGLAIAEELYRRYPEGDEGELARLRAHGRLAALVRRRRARARPRRPLRAGAAAGAVRTRARARDEPQRAGRRLRVRHRSVLPRRRLPAHGPAVVAASRSGSPYAADEYVDPKTRAAGGAGTSGGVRKLRARGHDGPRSSPTLHHRGGRRRRRSPSERGPSRRPPSRPAAREALRGRACRAVRQQRLRPS